MNSRNPAWRRALNAPRRVADELRRYRQRRIWNQVGNGFARPFLDRWGYFREGRTEGINRLRSIAGGIPLLLPYRNDHVPEELWSPRRINVLARELHLTSYLEIGVLDAETFVNVETRRRYGVDPHPLFDAVLMPKGSRFAAMTSDEFFETIGRRTRFDIAFIDGLHTLEQSYRDVINTFSHLRHGVILMDDTIPSDEVSAIPDQTESFRVRDQVGLDGRPWHGDVWRTIALFERHHPELEWCTIIDEGNPQTLVWRRRRRTRVSAAPDDDVALVKQLDYSEEFADGVPTYFHAMSESEALTHCIRSLRR